MTVPSFLAFAYDLAKGAPFASLILSNLSLNMKVSRDVMSAVVSFLSALIFVH